MCGLNTQSCESAPRLEPTVFRSHQATTKLVRERGCRFRFEISTTGFLPFESSGRHSHTLIATNNRVPQSQRIVTATADDETGYTAPVFTHAWAKAPAIICIPGAGPLPNPAAHAQATSESVPIGLTIASCTQLSDVAIRQFRPGAESNGVSAPVR